MSTIDTTAKAQTPDQELEDTLYRARGLACLLTNRDVRKNAEASYNGNTADAVFWLLECEITRACGLLEPAFGRVEAEAVKNAQGGAA